MSPTMKFLAGLSLGLSCGVSAAAVTRQATDGKGCSQVTFTANGIAQNLNITPDMLNAGNMTQILAAAANAEKTTVSGAQTIAGTFCYPTVSNANNQKLQFFSGSITSNRGEWQALGGPGTDFPEYQPGNYSWTDYSNAQGYPTLAIDRLGNGRSSHPDPILIVQAPYEIELYSDIANQIRAGTGPLPKAYNHLIYIGNSYGSQLGASIAGQHPTAFNEFILTGFTPFPQPDLIGVGLVALPLPAAIVDPARFGNLSLGYVTTASEIGRTGAFFTQPSTQTAVDPAIPHLFYVRKDVVSIGQVLSVYLYPFNGAGFTGRVLVQNGAADSAFCGFGVSLLPADCAAFEGSTAALFPDADFNYHVVPLTGHAQPFFLASKEILSTPNAFLAGASYSS